MYFGLWFVLSLLATLLVGGLGGYGYMGSWWIGILGLTIFVSMLLLGFIARKFEDEVTNWCEQNEPKFETKDGR